MKSTRSERFDKAMGGVVREEMLARNLTMQQIGDKMGVSYQQIAKYCSGVNGFSAFRLTQIAAILCLSVGDLCARVGIPEPEPTPADYDAMEAARLMRKIESPFHREMSVHIIKKFAYSGANA